MNGPLLMPERKQAAESSDWPPEKRRPSPLWLVAVVLVLGMIGIWFYILGDDAEQAARSQAPPLAAVIPSQQPMPEPVIRSVPREGDAAREIIAAMRDSSSPLTEDDLHAKSREFTAAGQHADAHLLLFFNARRGHAASALALGRIYDPKYHTTAYSIVGRADPAQAYKWYSRAAAAGDPSAHDHLGELKQVVSAQAMQGDENALLLLKRWRD